MFLCITFSIAFFSANKFLHKTVEALNDGVFQVRTFFDNPKTFFEKDNSDAQTESNYDIPKDINSDENYNTKGSEDFKSNNDHFSEIEKNSPNSNDIENEQQQNKIEINNNENEDSQKQEISQNDQNQPQKETQEKDNNIHSNENLDSQSQEDITKGDKHAQNHEEIPKESKTQGTNVDDKNHKEMQKEPKTQGANVGDKNQENPKIINHDQNQVKDSVQHESINQNSEENHLNQEAENNQGKAKSQINENLENGDDNDDFKIREYPHLKSYIYEIKSATQVNPPPLVGKIRSFLKSIESTSAGKTGNYWEIAGKEANFTFRFKPSLVRGIRLYKTDRPCEIYTFQIIETTRDYVILDDSYLKYPVQQFIFPIFIQTEELKLKVLKTQGESETVCLFNYSLLTV